MESDHIGRGIVHQMFRLSFFCRACRRFGQTGSQQAEWSSVRVYLPNEMAILGGQAFEAQLCYGGL